EPGAQPGLTCHIEIDNEIGRTPREIAETTARALRALAAQVEAGTLDDGFHPINILSGDEIGRIYIDWHATIYDR
ncbi:MAG: hypothetical protein KGJ06_09755, partial [Pseudomonadota bacterium]|nr:hypothetical protein [Pseudomonadota bacterium]